MTSTPAMVNGSHSNSRNAASRYSTGTSIPSRTASTSTLPSIRSLRKAFQFSNNSNNKHHSFDGSSDTGHFSPSSSTSTTRTFSSGSLSIPRPVLAANNSNASRSISSHDSGNAVIARSSSTSDAQQQQQPATNVPSGLGTDGPSSSSSPGPEHDNDNLNSFKNADNNDRAPNSRDSARPLSSQTIPSQSTVYSSVIPVKSRPASISSSTIRSISSRAELKLQSSPPLPAIASPTLLKTASFEEDQLNVDEEEMAIMHIRSGSTHTSTPPPVIPLPPVPSMLQDSSSSSTNGVYQPRPVKRVNATLNRNRYSLEIPRGTNTVSKSSSTSSLMDEPAPEAFEHVNNLSITSPPPPPPVPARRSPLAAISTTSLSSLSSLPSSSNHQDNEAVSRPSISRSRSAIESIKAMAEEADILNASTSSISNGHGNQDGNTRSRQTSLPKPLIMESPSRSPAVVDANKMFNFPIPSSSSAIGGTATTGEGKLNVLPALSAEIMNTPSASSGSMTGTSLSRSRSSNLDQDGMHDLGNVSTTANSSSDLHNSTTSSYLRGLRHSSTSPLSVLVQRLNVNSPIKDGHISPVAGQAYTHDEMDNADLRSELDPSEENGQYLANINGEINGHTAEQHDSPFITQDMMEDDSLTNVEDGSVEGSSGISAAPPSRMPGSTGIANGTTPQQQQRQTFERTSGRRVSADEASSSGRASASAREVNTNALREFESRISPQTEKRWSMAEVEAAYGRIRKIATRRSSAAVSEAPSFLISEDSKDMAPSYVQHLIDRGFPLDASMTSSSLSHAGSRPSSDLGRFATTNGRLSPRRDLSAKNDNLTEEGDEAGDALTPLVGKDRYSPSTSPRVSPRALSPQTFAPFSNRSPRNSYLESRTDSPHSSGTTGSTNHGASGDKSNPSPAYTAPTTARHSQESDMRPMHTTTAPPILRSVSDQDARPTHVQGAHAHGWRRRASAEASSAASSGAGSDDTGWVTPKTSAGDHVSGRRRSISPALTATRRGSSAMDHYDETPHHTTTARRASSTKQRRPVSYSSSVGTDSLPGAPQHGRTGSFRYTHGPSHSASQSSLWFDDTPKAASKSRPSIPSDFRSSMANHPHRRQASSYSTSGSTYSFDSLGTSSFAEAKRADKIDLFLRCTKAESALQAITAHSQIEREALLDALQESRAMIDALRQQNEELITELDHVRRQGTRKPAVESQEAARRIAEIVEARDEWQARAQTMERDLAATRQAQAKNATDSEAALANMRQEIKRLQEQLTASAKVPKSPARNLPRATSLPKRSSPSNNNSSNPLKISMSPSGLPRSTAAMKSSVNGGIPRSRHSSGTNSIGFSPHGRTASNASSTFQTDFGDHLPASSDGWSLGDSQDASLRLDDSTARFLQDIDGTSVRSRQKSTTSSN